MLLETHGQPEFITLMLGTNDCKTVFSASADVIGKGVARLLEQARQCAPKSRVLVISPIYLGEQVWEDGFDPEFSPESVEVSKRLGDVYEKIANRYGAAFLRASDYVKSRCRKSPDLCGGGRKEDTGDVKEIYRKGLPKGRLFF